MSPEMIVIEALELLHSKRDANGHLPPRSLNNYLSLKHALEYGDCEDWTILSLAKQIIFGGVKDSLED
jgi:hypothetical protein